MGSYCYTLRTTERISICSDSQSKPEAIPSGTHDTQRLDNRKGPTTLTWVPGYKSIPGNEATDELAKAAAIVTDPSPRPISFTTAKMTHHYRCPVQLAPNSHGVSTFLPEGRLHRHLQQGRCRSPSPPTIRMHTTSQGVRPLT